MNEELITTLKDILFQLHAITTQNYVFASASDNERLRNYGMTGMEAEQAWMKGFLENKGVDPAWVSGNSSSSDS